MNAQLEQLSQSISRLPPADRGFAQDLVTNGRQRGLSPKQQYWVGKLLQRANPDGEDAPHVENFAGIIALFATAGANLKHPKVRLRTKDGHTVCLGVCGSRSRHSGAINMTDGAGYYDAKWWGRIEVDGRVTLSSDGERIRPALTELLQRLSTRPALTAAEYGKLTGQCTFCNRPLEDEKSTAVGYGPTCAKNFNLPWGASASARASQSTLI